jgi:kinesin family protein 13
MIYSFLSLFIPAEKYTRGVSAVESILVLDRLRQSVAVKELEAQQSKQQLTMRKTASVPNFSQVKIFCVAIISKI